MLKILYYGESPANPTGFGQVNKHILAALSRVAKVTLVASSFYLDSHDFPYEIVRCSDANDPRNLPAIKEHIQNGAWDVFFYQGDIGANNDVLAWVKEETDKDPKKNSIFYMPVDTDYATAGSFIPMSWCTVPVVYTNHGKGVIDKLVPYIASKTSVIWLGCEADVFYPLSPEEKRAARIELFGEKYLDRFLVVNVNRNQARKDLARCMAAFHLFHKTHPDATLYMHSVQDDSAGYLPVQAHLMQVDIYNQDNPEIVFSGLDLQHPWSREQLNRLYNACDCLVSTSYGEGWGLTTTEAMCAGIPVVVPANTANLDILQIQGDGSYRRGWGVETGGDLDHTTFVYSNGGSPCAFIHVDSFLENLEYVYLFRDHAEHKAIEARKWCEENTWEHREKDWENLIKLMEKEHG